MTMEPVKVPAGSSLQKAIDAAAPGTTILLDPGATYIGPFVLRNKGDIGDYINIDSAGLSALPEQKRVGPADLPHMPNLITNGRNIPIWQTEPGAHRYRRRGLHMCPASPTTPGVANLAEDGDGSSKQNSLDKVPFDLEWDRCLFDAYDRQEARRGIALNSASTRVLYCYLANFKRSDEESCAIGLWNGPGPYEIRDCYLEAACQNFMVGGANCAIPNVVPADCLIEDCDMDKRLSWRQKDPSWDGIKWWVKNIVEWKCGERFKMNRCRLKHSWGANQPGIAISVKCSDTGGATPWTRTHDIILTNLEIEDVNQGFTIAGQWQPIQNLHISNVRITRCSRALWGDAQPLGNPFQISGTAGCTIEYVSYDGDGDFMKFPRGSILSSGAPALVSGLRFTDNIGTCGGYGIKGDGAASGMDSIKRYAPDAAFERCWWYGINPKLLAAHPKGTNTYGAPPGYHADLPADIPLPTSVPRTMAPSAAPAAVPPSVPRTTSAA